MSRLGDSIVWRREARVVNATEKRGTGWWRKKICCKQTIKHRTEPTIPTGAECGGRRCDSCQKAQQ